MKTIDDVIEMYQGEIRDIAAALGFDPAGFVKDYGTSHIKKRIVGLMAAVEMYNAVVKAYSEAYPDQAIGPNQIDHHIKSLIRNEKRKTYALNRVIDLKRSDYYTLHHGKKLAALDEMVSDMKMLAAGGLSETFGELREIADGSPA